MNPTEIRSSVRTREPTMAGNMNVLDHDILVLLAALNDLHIPGHREFRRHHRRVLDNLAFDAHPSRVLQATNRKSFAEWNELPLKIQIILI